MANEEYKCPVGIENIFVALQEQGGGHRIFVARGTSRNISHASADELAWIFDRFPSVKKVFLAGKHTEDV